MTSHTITMTNYVNTMTKRAITMTKHAILYTQEGNTPYSLALSDKNPEIAAFVMSLAAQTPKPLEMPTQMTIFDLQVQVQYSNLLIYTITLTHIKLLRMYS